MEEIDRKIARILRIPGVLNWARQNFARTDDTTIALQKLVDAEIVVSLAPVYALCARVAYRELSYDQAFEKALTYKHFHRNAAIEILPLFHEYLMENQIEALVDFKNFRAPYPIGRNASGQIAAIPVRPTFVTIKDGRLLPVFMLGWVNSPLKYSQRRLASAIIRRSILTQTDFRGSDAQIISFPRIKNTTVRQRGGWMNSDFEDLSDDQVLKQIGIYNKALNQVIEQLMQSRDRR